MWNKVRVGERNRVRVRVQHRGIIDRATARIATGTRDGAHGVSHGGEHRLATATFTPARAPRRQQQPSHRHDSVQMAQIHEVFSISREAPGGGPTPPSLRTAASRLDPARRHNEKRMIRHRDYAARSPGGNTFNPSRALFFLTQRKAGRIVPPAPGLLLIRGRGNVGIGVRKPPRSFRGAGSLFSENDHAARAIAPVP
jgi:hypothetical protein